MMGGNVTVADGAFTEDGSSIGTKDRESEISQLEERIRELESAR